MLLNIISISKYINEDKICYCQFFYYIKNQFFVTGSYNSQVRNQIGDALYQRIERAHK
jgi:ribonucleotide reductase beta subunit family protein with ferritin-like domain